MRAVESNISIYLDNSSDDGGRLHLVKTAPQAPPSDKLRILVVEDDEGDAYLIRRALAKNPRVGEIVLAENGVEALDLIDRGAVKPDLALIDLHMPRKDGFALLRDFATRKSAQFPSVVLTSSRAGADALRSLKRGAVEFVTKPSTEVKLAAALDRVIAKV